MVDFRKLNWIRAGVLGANDGIISVATVLIAVTGNLTYWGLLLVAVSTIVAGALSMSIGEYVSVSAQKDAEIAGQRKEITNPWHAAMSSLASFIAGAIIPAILAVLTQNIWITIGGVIIALTLTGYISAKAGGLPATKPVIRNLVAGVVALTIAVTVNILFATLTS